MKVQYVRDLVEGKKPDTVLHGILSNSCWKESLFFVAPGLQWPSCLHEWTLEARKNSEKLCFELFAVRRASRRMKSAYSSVKKPVTDSNPNTLYSEKEDLQERWMNQSRNVKAHGSRTRGL